MSISCVGLILPNQSILLLVCSCPFDLCSAVPQRRADGDLHDRLGSLLHVQTLGTATATRTHYHGGILAPGKSAFMEFSGNGLI